MTTNDEELLRIKKQRGAIAPGLAAYIVAAPANPLDDIEAIRKINFVVKDGKIVNCGRICLGHKKINFSTVFAGQAVGIKEVHDDVWLVSFMDYDLGYFDPGDSRVGTRGKSLRPKSVTYVAGTLPMCPGWTVPFEVHRTLPGITL